MDSPQPKNSKPFFSSARERRLWAWTFAVLVAIFSSLGLARTLADVLHNSGLDASLFLLGCFLVLATVVTEGLKTRPGGTEIGVALGVAAAYIMIFVRMASPVERSHLVEYGVVAVFIYEALLERASQGRRVSTPAFFAIMATSLIGVLDEFVQKFIPGRVFDYEDIIFNVLASVMAVVTCVLLGGARRRFRKS